jgi:hypothetical protein
LAPEFNQYNYEDSMAGGLPAVTPQPVQPVQSTEPAQPDYIDSLSKQILGQGMTDKWTGQGFGSAEANARDMAKILAGIGITDISQFGPITEQVQEIVGTDDGGNPIYDTQTRNTFGNKLTGQAVPLTYSGRQTGNFFGGTYEGKGNTGYGVQFDEQGNPFFYTQGASSSDVGKLAPLLAIAQFIPALAPFATAANAAIAASQGNVLGAIAGAAGLGGYSDIANAANFAGALKSGNPLGIISSGANLGGMDLSGAANAAGLRDLNNIAGFNLNDISKTYQTVKALKSGDPASIISALGGYVAGQGSETPSIPTDSFEPFPSEPVTLGADPVGTSLFNRPIDSSIDVDPTDTPRIAFNPMDLYQELPKSAQQTPAVDQTPDMSGKSFNSAFAQARASGAKEFLWEGNVYNTKLADTATKTYDPVGGGRGEQGGPTAQELARANAVRGNPPPSDFANFASSVFPSAQAGSVAGIQPPDLASQIPGYGGPVPPSTYDQNNSIFGRVADDLGLPQEFQRNFSNTLNALPGVNLPFGAAGRYVGKGVDKVDDVLDPNWHTASGQRIYFNPDVNRWTPADPTFQNFVRNNSYELQGNVGKVFQEAAEEISKGNYTQAFSILDKNPTAQKMMLEKASFLGAHGVGPHKQLQHLGALNAPPAYTLNQGSGQYSAATSFYGKGKAPNVPRVNPPPQIPEVPKGYQRSGNRPPGGRAEGGLASLNRSSEQ